MIAAVPPIASGKTSVRPGRQVLWRGVALLLGTVFALALCELALGLIGSRPSYAAWRRISLTYLLDDATDWRLEPRRYDWGQINEGSFRGPKVSRAKPPGVYRILVLGGSAAFDLYKRDHQTWSVQLQRLLDRHQGARVEVINAGTPGFSSWHALRQLEQRMIHYDPDLVLLYELYNDSLMFRFSDRAQIARAWKVNAQGNYVCAAAHPDPVWDAAGKLLPATVDFVRMLWVDNERRQTRADLAATLYRPQLDARATPEGIAFYAGNVERMAALLEARGIAFGVVTQASLLREQNPPEHLDKFQLHYRGMTHAELWSAYQLAWRSTKPVVDRHANAFLIPAHLLIPADLRYFLDEVHLSHEGSTLLASIIARAVREGLWSSGPR